MYHETADGDLVKIRELKTKHLANICARIRILAKQGMVIEDDPIIFPDDYDDLSRELDGEEVLEYLNYDAYKRELDRRAARFQELFGNKSARKKTFLQDVLRIK